MDIMVTTPSGMAAEAAKEAQECIDKGGGTYFRRLGTVKPKLLKMGDRIFYVEQGFIRGFAVVVDIAFSIGNTCNTTGNQFKPGWYTYSLAESWSWVKPIKWTGFQGWRYFPSKLKGQVEVVGGWLDPKPKE